ncbi:MAG: HSGNP motif-containing (seleno)protein [Thermodesulfobacteriota bacterium]
MTCKKAMGVAEEMKKKYGKKLELKIYTTDSEEAKPYNFKSSTNVFFQKEAIPIDIAIDSKKMETFLSQTL